MRLPACFLLLVSPVFGIEGRVFVATKGGDFVTLASVKIRAYRTADYVALVRHSDGQKKKYDRTARRLATLLDEAAEIPQSSVSEDDKTRLFERNSAEAKSLMEELAMSAPSFLSNLPLKPVAETTSDATGNYRLPLKETAKVVIVAVADRLVSGSPEHYYWLIFAPPEDLNLSSETLTRKMPWDPSLLNSAVKATEG